MYQKALVFAREQSQRRAKAGRVYTAVKVLHLQSTSPEAAMDQICRKEILTGSHSTPTSGSSRIIENLACDPRGLCHTSLLL